MLQQMKSPIFVALDVDDRQRALQIAREVEPFVGGFKVGPRLCLRYGADLVSELSRFGQVFVDNKYFDIPNTMIHAVRASFEAGATFVTVHAQAGKLALSQLAELERTFNQIRPFRLLAVTVLTSFGVANLPPLTESLSIMEQVKILAQLVFDSGLRGLVCSPHEVAQVKTLFPEIFAVTPGIRFPQGEENDQQRVMGPYEAMKAGASLLVVGRPIVEAENPRQAARLFFEATTSQ